MTRRRCTPKARRRARRRWLRFWEKWDHQPFNTLRTIERLRGKPIRFDGTMGRIESVSWSYGNVRGCYWTRKAIVARLEQEWKEAHA